MSEIRESIAESIRSHRAARRWTQRTLADRMGWSQPTASAAELGTKGFSIDEVFKLAEIFDVTVNQLFRDAPENVRRRLGAL